MPKLNTTTSGIITTTLTADSSPTLELQQNGVAIRTLGESQLVMGTAQSTATGAVAYDFTGIPSWAKRITVMFSGVSTSGASAILVQLGYSGGIESTGYASGSCNDTGSIILTSTAGFLVNHASVAAGTYQGQMIISLLGSNNYVETCTVYRATTGQSYGGGTKTTTGTLDRVRITTVNGTDTFDAGTVNIMWE